MTSLRRARFVIVGTNPYRAVDKLWSRITFRRDGCWYWKGATNGGYGTVYWGSRHRRVHVLVYELLRGPIPRELELDHLCRKRICCNPAHLEPVAHRENIRRGRHRMPTEDGRVL